MTLVESSRRAVEDRFANAEGAAMMGGVQALVRALFDHRQAELAAGRNTSMFISGYEGSPLGGFDLELGRHRPLLDKLGIVHRPGVNEELAVTAVLGSQVVANDARATVDGVVGVWYGKAPGLDRAMDALRHANFGGVSPLGGALLAVGDDAMAKSSSLPSGSESALASLGIPTLVASDPQDVLDMALHGIAMSRRSGLWSALKIETGVADAYSNVEFGPHRIATGPPPSDPDGYRHVPTSKLVHEFTRDLERTAYTVRVAAAQAYAREHGLNRAEGVTGDDRLGIIAAGRTWRDTLEALQALGIEDLAASPVRVLKLGLVWPLDAEIVREFAAGVGELLVVEDKRAFTEMHVKDALYGSQGAPAVVGKSDERGAELFRPYGQLSTAEIAAVIADRLGMPRPDEGRRTTARTTIPLLLQRTPYWCSGCPHNKSTVAPDGALVGAGIGCHTMALRMPSDRVGEVATLTQMGGEGVQWVGMSPFTSVPHMFQNLGDGTFFHSGSLAVRASVDAGVNVTYKLLYNSAVAMTGGQRPAGVRSVPELTRLLLAEGVRKVIVTTDDPSRYRGVALAPGTTVRHRRELLDVQRELSAVTGVTVMIHDEECAAEQRRRKKREPAGTVARVAINPRVCEGCGDCGQVSNCLSLHPIETTFGEKTTIDQTSCNEDMACVDGHCPSFVSIVARGARRRRPDAGPNDVSQLVEPAVRRQGARIRFTGIGGTGIVTAARVLGEAATNAGYVVRGVDQTGLAQKGGPVVSDIIVAPDAVNGASRLTDGSCDVYIAADLLVGADANNLTVVAAGHTAAVVSTSVTPSGRMVLDRTLTLDPSDYVDVIARAVGADAVVAVDAQTIARSEFGGDQYANMFLLGVASQRGLLPVAPSDVEAALHTNGVQVAMNVRAFRAGRIWAAAEGHPDGSSSVPPGIVAPAAAGLLDDLDLEPGSPLAATLGVLVADLVRYQNVRYAKRFLSTVGKVLEAERRIAPTSHELTAAVARGLHKLMAYKDEYEVAALATDPAFIEQLRDEFGAESKLGLLLEPPILQAVGLKRKIKMGPRTWPLLRLLVRGRPLRGTLLDPFGYAHVRKVERELVRSYVGAINDVVGRLGPANLEQAVHLARLPDMVRGYDHVKLRTVERYTAELATACAALGIESRPG